VAEEETHLRPLFVGLMILLAAFWMAIVVALSWRALW
jgi:hypothetical protein